jgi:chorismate dehydratase
MKADLLRFGYTDSIHLLPLLYPLRAGWVYPTGVRLELVALAPPDLPAALESGDLDGGLVDPLAYARLRGRLEVMPGIGLAGTGANSLAVLRSTVRPDELDAARIAVAPEANASVAPALLRALATPYFGITLDLDDDNGVAQDPGAEGGAPRLLYGDSAVRAREPWLRYEARFTPGALAAAEASHDTADAGGQGAGASGATAPDPATAGYAEDLGAAWWVLTGTPMVWALGVLHASLVDTAPQAVVAVVRAFQESRTAARQQADTVRAAAAQQAGISEAAVEAVFARQTVEIGAVEQGGLAAFYRHTGRPRLT